jgi:hypothetical protein
MVDESLAPRTDAAIRVSMSRTDFAPDPAVLDTCRTMFERDDALYLDGFLDLPLLASLQGVLRRGRFAVQTIANVGEILVENPNLASRALNLVLQRQEIFAWLHSVTGCGPLRGVDGRVLRSCFGLA